MPIAEHTLADPLGLRPQAPIAQQELADSDLGEAPENRRLPLPMVTVRYPCV